MPLLTLPNELLLDITECLHTLRDKNALARTCHQLYSLVNDCIYSLDVKSGQGAAIHWAASKDLVAPALLSLAQGGNIDVVALRPPSIVELRDSALYNAKLHLTPLQRAVGCMNESIIHVLVHHGADVQRTYPDPFASFTPLHVASALGLCGVVRILLVSGAQVDAVDKYRQTPLHYAAKGNKHIVKTPGHVKAVNLLLQYGASNTQRTKAVGRQRT